MNKKAIEFADKIVELYNDKIGIPDIAKQLELPQSTVRRTLLRNGVTLRTIKTALSLVPNKLGCGMRGKKRCFSEEHKRRISESREKWAETHTPGMKKQMSRHITQSA